MDKDSINQIRKSSRRNKIMVLKENVEIWITLLEKEYSTFTSSKKDWTTTCQSYGYIPNENKEVKNLS